MEGPTEVVGPNEIEAFVDEWRALAAVLPATSYFQTPDWVISWWETIGDRVPTRYALWRDGAGKLEAVVALSRVRERLHRLVPLPLRLWVNTGSGPGAGDHCGWPVSAARKHAVASWVAANTSGALELRSLGSGADYVPAGARVVASAQCPRLELAPGAPIGRSRNFRQQLRARRRKVEAAGVMFAAAEGGEIGDDLLLRIVELHGARSTEMSWASSFDLSRLPFHQALIARSGPGRGPAVVTATHDGQVIGGVYGFWWGDTYSYYQLGWDQSWAELSLGTVLLAEAIEYVSGRGGAIFDFLRGAERFKYRFGAVDATDESWLLPRGWGGRILAWKRGRQRSG